MVIHLNVSREIEDGTFLANLLFLPALQSSISFTAGASPIDSYIPDFTATGYVQASWRNLAFYVEGGPVPEMRNNFQ